jgi:hypothetical protein
MKRIKNILATEGERQRGREGKQQENKEKEKTKNVSLHIKETRLVDKRLQHRLKVRHAQEDQFVS